MLNRFISLFAPLVTSPFTSRSSLPSLLLVLLFSGLAGTSQAQSQRLLCIGDSIAEGWPSSEPSFRLFLYDQLKARSRAFRYVGDRVGNYGGSGNSSPITTWPASGWPSSAQRHACVSGIFASDYANNGKVASVMGSIGSANYPDIALIHLGHNDMGHFANATTTKNYLGTIIDQLRAYNPNMKILLAKVIPAGNSWSGSNYPLVSQLNAQIPGLVASKNTAASPVLLVDQNAGFSITDLLYRSTYEPLDNFGLNPDNVHPTHAGQAEMARRWMKILDAQLSPPSVTITSPANGTSATIGGTISVQVTGAAPRGLQRIRLFANGVFVGSQTTANPTFTVSVSSAEPIVLSAHILDNDGQDATSAPVVMNTGSSALSTALSGIRAWYRSDSRVETVSGGILRWGDLSGNDFHMYQRNPSDRPTLAANRFLDKPGVMFSDSPGQFLTAWDGMPVNSDYTKVVVCKIHDYAPVNNLLSAGTSPNGAHALWYGSSTTPEMYRFGSNSDSSVSYGTSSIPTPLNQTECIINTYSAASNTERIFQDNVLGGSATAYRDNSEASMQMGGYDSLNYLDGEIAEVIIYNRVLSTAERAAITQYLDDRYKSLPNQPPVFTATTGLQVHPGDTVSLPITATDPDAGQSLTYSITSGAPTGATINPSTGVFNWNVPAGELPGAAYTVALSVADNGSPSLSDSETLGINVVLLPCFTDVVITNGMEMVFWSGINGRVYDLDGSTNLVTPVWSPLGPVTNPVPITRPAGMMPFDLYRLRP